MNTKHTPEEKRIRIAELDGWDYEKREGYPKRRPKWYEYILQSPDQALRVLPKFTVSTANPETDVVVGIGRLPDYLNNRDAIVGAIKRRFVTDDQQKAFMGVIREVAYSPGKGWFSIVTATAEQLADAYLQAAELAQEDPAQVQLPL